MLFLSTYYNITKEEFAVCALTLYELPYQQRSGVIVFCIRSVSVVSLAWPDIIADNPGLCFVVVALYPTLEHRVQNSNWILIDDDAESISLQRE